MLKNEIIRFDFEWISLKFLIPFPFLIFDEKLVIVLLFLLHFGAEPQQQDCVDVDIVLVISQLFIGLQLAVVGFVVGGVLADTVVCRLD